MTFCLPTSRLTTGNFLCPKQSQQQIVFFSWWNSWGRNSLRTLLEPIIEPVTQLLLSWQGRHFSEIQPHGVELVSSFSWAGLSIWCGGQSESWIFDTTLSIVVFLTPRRPSAAHQIWSKSDSDESLRGSARPPWDLDLSKGLARNINTTLVSSRLLTQNQSVLVVW